MNLSSRPIRALAEEIRRGTLSPVDLVNFHLGEIEKRNGSLNALCAVYKAEALKTAQEREQEARAGTFRGRLHGIVFTAKESVEIAGMLFGSGSKVVPSKTASRTSAIADRLIAEGAICIGKGNMPEYGKAYCTENEVYGRTSNPFNEEYTSGGSSGGDAAAVAAHFASFGVCTDAGGSVRVPASFCGLYGLCSTAGSFSEGGGSTPGTAMARLFRRYGFVSRYADDLEILRSLSATFDLSDPYSAATPSGSGHLPSTGSFLYFDSIGPTKVVPQISAAVHSVVASLEKLGFKGKQQTPSTFERSLDPFLVLAVQSSTELNDAVLEERNPKRDLSDESSLMKATRKRVAAEMPELTARIVLKNWHLVDALRCETAPLFRDHEFIISPLAATPPFKHGAATVEVEGQSLNLEENFRFSSAVNTLGLPAVAIPVGFSDAGLPIGIQIIGPRFSDAKLIALASELGR